MAATDLFERIVVSLTQKERDIVQDYLQQQRQDLLAARSEEARVRIVEELVAQIHDRLRPLKR